MDGWHRVVWLVGRLTLLALGRLRFGLVSDTSNHNCCNHRYLSHCMAWPGVVRSDLSVLYFIAHHWDVRFFTLPPFQKGWMGRNGCVGIYVCVGVANLSAR